MKKKLIGILCLAILLGAVGYLTVYPGVIRSSVSTSLRSIAIAPGLLPAHQIRPPAPYVYFYVGQAYLEMGGVVTGWNLNYHGYPVWGMDDDDTASSVSFAFPAGADKGYLSVLPLADNAADSINMNFTFETRNSFAGVAANYGTKGKGWYEVAAVEIETEDANEGVDTLQRVILSFPTKAQGNQWRLSCDTYEAANHFHMHGFDSTALVVAQVTFGFPGEKQYCVQMYPDPDQSDEVTGDLFRIQGNVDAADSGTADTSYTCFAPAFTHFTVWAVPDSYKANGSDSINAYIALDAKALRGLYDVAGWYPIDSINLDAPGDSCGESMTIIGATEGFFDQYRIRYHQSADALSDSLETTVRVYGVFSP